MNEIQQLLLSDLPLLISRSGYMQLMVSAFPSLKNIVATKGETAEPLRLSFFGFQEESYTQKSVKELEKIKKTLSQVSDTPKIRDQ